MNNFVPVALQSQVTQPMTDQWYTFDLDSIDHGSTHLDGMVTVQEPTIPKDKLVENIHDRMQQHNLGYDQNEIEGWNLDEIIAAGKKLLRPEYLEHWRIDDSYISTITTDREPFAKQMQDAVNNSDSSYEFGRAVWWGVRDTHHDTLHYNIHNTPPEYDYMHKIKNE